LRSEEEKEEGEEIIPLEISIWSESTTEPGQAMKFWPPPGSLGFVALRSAFPCAWAKSVAQCPLCPESDLAVTHKRDVAKGQRQTFAFADKKCQEWLTHSASITCVEEINHLLLKSNCIKGRVSG
jgi:hypothetical protein